MKKNVTPKKITLSRETLRLLNDPNHQLRAVNGGMPISVPRDTYCDCDVK